jgi:hypothetical protein
MAAFYEASCDLTISKSSIVLTPDPSPKERGALTPPINAYNNLHSPEKVLTPSQQFNGTLRRRGEQGMAALHEGSYDLTI